MPLLEKLEAGALYHDHIAKVDRVHDNLSGADDLMDHHSVEPHSFRRHAADLTPSYKLSREAVTHRHLRAGVTSSKGEGGRKRKHMNYWKSLLIETALGSKYAYGEYCLRSIRYIL